MEASKRKVQLPVVTITIQARGSKKFKQALVDRIYQLLMEDDFIGEASRAGNGLDFESSQAPSDEVM